MTARHGRLPWLTPADLDEAQRSLYDEIVGGPRASGPLRLTDDEGRLEGPFNAMLTAPSVGHAVQRLGAAIRYESSLGDRIREAAILQVARHHRSDFEWRAHERIGLAAGLTVEEIAGIRAGRIPGSFDEREVAAANVVESLLVTRDLDDALHERTRGTLGRERLAELVALVGYYELLALSLRVWRTPLPSGVEPTFG